MKIGGAGMGGGALPVNERCKRRDDSGEQTGPSDVQADGENRLCG